MSDVTDEAAERPETDAEQLRVIADYLDTADKAVVIVCELLKKPVPVLGSEMQDDLRRIADRVAALDGAGEGQQ